MLTDLLYLGNVRDYSEVSTLLTSQFPEGKVEDASDFIHTYRLEFTHPSLSVDDYLVWALREGLQACSLKIQIMRYDTAPDVRERLMKAMRLVVSEQ